MPSALSNLQSLRLFSQPSGSLSYYSSAISPHLLTTYAKLTFLPQNTIEQSEQKKTWGKNMENMENIYLCVPSQASVPDFLSYISTFLYLYFSLFTFFSSLSQYFVSSLAVYFKCSFSPTMLSNNLADPLKFSRRLAT